MYTLGDVCTKPQYGWTTSAATSGSIKLLRTTDITRGKIDWSTVPFCRDAPPDVDKYLLEDGDIVISRAGSVGVSYRVAAPDRAIFASYLIRFRPKEGLDGEYLAFYLQSPSYWSHIEDSTSGIAVPNVNATKLEAIPIPVPALDVQRAIVASLEEQFSRLDAGIAALKRAQANLKRYRASVLKAACEGRLVPTEYELALDRQPPMVDAFEEFPVEGPDDVSENGTLNMFRRREREQNALASFETGEQLLARILEERRRSWSGKGSYKEPVPPEPTNLAPLPLGWTWTQADTLFTFVTSGSRGWAAYYSPSGAKFIRIGNLDHENIRLDLANVQHVDPPDGVEGARTLVAPNDLLVSITADVGMVAVAPDNLGKAYINQHVALARPVKSLSPKYLAYYLASDYGGWGWWKRNQRGATKAGLGLADIKAVPVPLPPPAEQERIVAEVERSLSVVDQLEQTIAANLARATSLRSSILQTVFGQASGQSASLKLPHQQFTATDKPREGSIMPASSPVKNLQELLQRMRPGDEAITPRTLLALSGLSHDIDRYYEIMREGRDSKLFTFKGDGLDVVITKHADS
jgi:type I restriction enzyme, S subunit